MRIGTKCYEHITITKDGEIVAKITDNEMALALGFELSARCVESSISREELLSLALYAVDEKIHRERTRCGSSRDLETGHFIEKITPLIKKREVLCKALEEAKSE